MIKNYEKSGRKNPGFFPTSFTLMHTPTDRNRPGEVVIKQDVGVKEFKSQRWSHPASHGNGAAISTHDLSYC
jgi:hypothetical protein